MLIIVIKFLEIAPKLGTLLLDIIEEIVHD